jgi:hypothetical protein
MTRKIHNINFGANNGMGAKQLFIQRALYDRMYPRYSADLMPGPINFRSTRHNKYGRISRFKDYIFPDHTKMKQIAGPLDNNVHALNFVVDAYQDFAKYTRLMRRTKFVPDGVFSTTWGAVNGVRDTAYLYDNYLNSMKDSFINTYLDDTNSHKEITSFESFMDIFFNLYLTNLIDRMPITKTGMLNSKYVDPMVSGLCIEIDGANHGDDKVKFNKYINNVNYPLYALSAAKFGFLVDKHAPWRLVANLSSPLLRPYIEKNLRIPLSSQFTTEGAYGHWHTYEIDNDGNGHTTEFFEDPSKSGLILPHSHDVRDFVVGGAPNNKAGVYANIPNHPHEIKYDSYGEFNEDDVYDYFFVPSYIFDIENLKIFMRNMYNEYISNYPVTVKPTIYSNKNYRVGASEGNPMFEMRTINRIITRIPTSMNDYESQYGDLFWIRLYFLLRLRELKVRPNESKIRANLKNLSNIYSSVDKAAALRYIQTYLKQFY